MYPVLYDMSMSMKGEGQPMGQNCERNASEWLQCFGYILIFSTSNTGKRLVGI